MDQENYKHNKTGEELQEQALAIFGSDESILRFIVESHGNVSIISYEEVYGKTWKNTFRRIYDKLTFTYTN